MSENTVRDHPTHVLPDFVRGDAPDAAAIERHLAGCSDCRVEVEILRALTGGDEMSDLERAAVYRAFERRRSEGDRRARLSPRTWRAAAAVVLIGTSAGVAAVLSGDRDTGWDPQAAIDGFERDLVELDAGPSQVRFALGSAGAGGAAFDPADLDWEDMEGVDPSRLPAPWEDER